MEFYLERDEDPSGISGTGRIAHGTLFEDGHVAMRWLTGHRSTAIYDSLYDVYKIHAHGGTTRLVGHRCTMGLAICGDERTPYAVAVEEDGDRVRVFDFMMERRLPDGHDPGFVREHYCVTEGERLQTLNHLWMNMSQATFEMGGPGWREPVWGSSPPKFDADELAAREG